MSNNNKLRRDEPQAFAEGKMPPHDLEAEKGLLTQLMNLGHLDEAAMWIENKPGFFYKNDHALIWNAYMDIHKSQGTLNLITVKNALVKAGNFDEIGGLAALVEFNQVPSGKSSVVEWLMILSELWFRRDMISKSYSINRSAYDMTEDVFSVSRSAVMSISDSEERISPSRPKAIRQSINQFVVDAVKASEGGKPQVDLIETGFVDFDKTFGGWSKGNLVLVGGRPGMGKTAFVISLAVRQAKRGIPVGILSLEMGQKELIARMISAEARISNGLLSKKPEQLSTAQIRQIDECGVVLSKLPIYIDDNPDQTIENLCGAIKALAQQGVVEIIIDYLQLISMGNGKYENRNDFIGRCTRRLKVTAKQANVAIILLSQLSRASEQRGGAKRPMLSDLRESGSIEQDADMVIFIHRPEYYGIPDLDNGDDSAGKAEIHVAKHRNGALDCVVMNWNASFAEFADVPRESFGVPPQGNLRAAYVRDPSEPNKNQAGDAPF